MGPPDKATAIRTRRSPPRGQNGRLSNIGRMEMFHGKQEIHLQDCGYPPSLLSVKSFPIRMIRLAQPPTPRFPSASPVVKNLRGNGRFSQFAVQRTQRRRHSRMRGALSDHVLLSLRSLSSLRSKNLPKIERFSVFALQINTDSERYAVKLFERWVVDCSVFKNPRKSALICLGNCGKARRIAFRGSAGILPVLAGILPASPRRPGGWRGGGSVSRLPGRSARCRPERARRPRSPLPSAWPRRRPIPTLAIHPFSSRVAPRSRGMAICG